jgi:hypothetical protein
LTFRPPQIFPRRAREIIIRQEEFARLWTRTYGQSISNALATAPVTIPVIGTPTEPNGEAVAFDANGNGYYHLERKRIGSNRSITLPAPAAMAIASRKPSCPLARRGSFVTTAATKAPPGASPTFDDSTWSNGVAQFGYGNGDEKTVVSYGGNANNKYVTTYFRKQFVVANAPVPGKSHP